MMKHFTQKHTDKQPDVDNLRMLGHGQQPVLLGKHAGHTNEKPLASIGVVGAGYWGPNIIRNILANPDCTLAAICDLDKEKLHRAESLLPAGHRTLVTTDYNQLLQQPQLDAIAIITEIPSHLSLASQALMAGKHVFVEKPLATTSSDCTKLGKLANEHGKTLMVGHTFIYNAAVRELKRIVDSGELGDIYYLHAQRLNLGRIQTHVNALWSLAVHDVAITLHLFDERPSQVRAWGRSFITPGIEDIVFIDILFPSGRLAHLHVSWLDPEKRRQVTLVGDRKMVVYDDVSLDRKLSIYDKGVQKTPLLDIKYPEYQDFSGFQYLTRVGDVQIPQINFEEPLKTEVQHFVDCILGQVEKPLSGWQEGFEVVYVLEAAQQSLSSGGETVSLTWE